MARPVTLLALFFICFNLFSGMLLTTGVAGMLGIDAQVGGSDDVDQAIEEGDNVETGAPTSDTLFGMYNVLGSALGSIFGVIFPGLRMLYNAGVPAYIVGGPSTPGMLPPIFSFILTIGTISFFRGWDL